MIEGVNPTGSEINVPSTHPGPCSSAPEALLAQQSVAGSAVWLSGACHALLLQTCVVGIACYGSSAVSAQLSEQCVRRIASQRGRGLTALPADVGGAPVQCPRQPVTSWH